MAIASEGNVPVPTEASRTSMFGLTPFIPTPRSNFAGNGELCSSSGFSVIKECLFLRSLLFQSVIGLATSPCL